MPIYLYQCGDCGYHGEHLVMKEDDTPVDCEGCGSKNYKRTMSGQTVSTRNHRSKIGPNAFLMDVQTEVRFQDGTIFCNGPVRPARVDPEQLN